MFSPVSFPNGRTIRVNLSVPLMRWEIWISFSWKMYLLLYIYIYIYTLFGSQYQCRLPHCRIQFHTTVCHRYYKIYINIHICVFVYICTRLNTSISGESSPMVYRPAAISSLLFSWCHSDLTGEVWHAGHHSGWCLWYWEVLGTKQHIFSWNNGDHFDWHHPSHNYNTKSLTETIYQNHDVKYVYRAWQFGGLFY